MPGPMRSKTPSMLPPLPAVEEGQVKQPADGPLGRVKWTEDMEPGAVLDLEALAHRMFTGRHSERVKREANAAIIQSTDMLHFLESRPQPPPLEFDYDNWALDWDMEIPQSELVQPGDEPELLMWEISQRAFDDLQRLDGPHAATLWKRMGGLGARLQRVHRMVSSTKLKSAPLCDVVRPFLDRVREVSGRPALDYASVDDKVNALLGDAEVCTRELLDATAEGEMEIATEKHLEKADTLEQALEVLAAKYDLVADERRHFVRIETIQMERALNVSLQEADRLATTNAQQREARAKDLASLNEQARVRLRRTESLVAENKQVLSELDARLADIKVKQDVTWVTLEEQERVLRELAEQRLAVVKERLALMQRSREQSARQQAEDAFYRHHRTLLRLSIDNCDVLEEAVGVVKGFLTDNHVQVVRHLSEFDEVLKSSVDEVDEQYDTIFRELSVCLGDVIYKRDRKLHMLIAAKEKAEIKRELLSDTLNAEAKRYYEEAVDCEAKIHQVNDELAGLRKRYGEVLLVYRRRAGDRLAARLGDAYVSPEEEVGERNMQRRQRMVSIAAMILDPEKVEELQLDDVPTPVKAIEAIASPPSDIPPPAASTN